MKVTFNIINPMGAAGIALTGACALGGPNDDGQEPLRQQIVRSAADRVLAPAYADAAARLSELAVRLGSYADGVTAQTAAETDRTAAQQAFADAMAAWQRVEMLAVGPAGAPGLVTGGEGLRDEIYSWPTTNPCRIDEELTEGSFEDPSFFTANLVNVRGLDAVAYLLFVEEAKNACDATRPINKDGLWAALGEDEIARRRARYAALAAQDAADRAAVLAARWEPCCGDAYTAFVSAGTAGSPYATTRVALDEFSMGLFELESMVKERKLSATAPEELEGRFTGGSKDYVLANLAAARTIFYAAGSRDEGTGYDDWLAAVGQESLSAEVEAAFAEAEAAVRGVPGTFAEALESNPQALAPAADAVGRLTALLKGPFLAALSLMPPADGAGDAD